jgi:hypothetical protein
VELPAKFQPGNVIEKMFPQHSRSQHPKYMRENTSDIFKALVGVDVSGDETQGGIDGSKLSHKQYQYAKPHF